LKTFDVGILTRDRKELSRCFYEAMQSPCKKRHYAARLLSQDGDSIGAVNGWYVNTVKNAPISCTDCLREGIESGTRLELCRAFHAEQAVITKAIIEGISVSGSTLYVASAAVKGNDNLYERGKWAIRKTPGFYCTVCARTILAVGIRRVVIALADKDAPNGWRPYSLTTAEAWDSAYRVASGIEDAEGKLING